MAASGLAAATLRTVKRALKADPEYAFRCKRCGVELHPWGDDDVYAETYHLEEHYGIPLTTPAGRIRRGSCAAKFFASMGSSALDVTDAPGLFTSSTSCPVPSAETRPFEISGRFASGAAR
jgi:hypothetical protein